MALGMLFLFYFALHFCLLVWSVQLKSQSPRTWFIRALLIGMLYDNLVLAIGYWGFGQGWYETANIARFVLHATILPFLMLFGWSAMKACGIRFASNTFAYGFIWLLVLAGLGWGWSHEVLQLQLVGAEFCDHQRFVSSSKLPPIATIVSNLVILPMAAAIWKVSGWKWFFLGALFIFGVNGATATKPYGFMVGNGAELVFVFCLLLTEQFLSSLSRQRLKMQKGSS